MFHVGISSSKTYEDKSRTVQIEGREGKYQKATTLHERYANRPVDLETICLAQFSVSYDVVSKKKKNLTFRDNCSIEKGDMKIIDTDEYLPAQILFSDKKMSPMQLRSFRSVLRLHESKKKKEEHEFYYAEMLLFMPWRNEKEDLHRYDPKKCIEKYSKFVDTICNRRKDIFPSTDCIDEARSRLEELGQDLRPKHTGVSARTETDFKPHFRTE